MSKTISSSLDKNTFNKIIDIKNGMNNLRTNFNGYKISNNMISKNWLVGFVEGDGFFTSVILLQVLI